MGGGPDRESLQVGARAVRPHTAIESNQADRAAETPYEILSRFDLGPGGYAVAPASQAKEAVVKVIREKHRR